MKEIFFLSWWTLCVIAGCHTVEFYENMREPELKIKYFLSNNEHAYGFFWILALHPVSIGFVPNLNKKILTSRLNIMLSWIQN